MSRGRTEVKGRKVKEEGKREMQRLGLQEDEKEGKASGRTHGAPLPTAGP